MLVVHRLLIAHLVFYNVVAALQKPTSKSPFTPPLCGDCWCILSEADESCPKIPKYYFSPTNIQFFKEIILTDGGIQCNPVKPQGLPFNIFPLWHSIPGWAPCDITAFENGPDAVCTFDYKYKKRKDKYKKKKKKRKDCPTSYSLKTYINKAAAKAAGAYVTHTGSCGLCSSSKDLAVYMAKPDLTTEVVSCLLSGPPEDVLNCLTGKVGFTLECALPILLDAVVSLAYGCVQACLNYASDPSNGPPPKCELNECLQCQKDASNKAGEAQGLSQDYSTFYAGRNSLNSGLVSNIVRPCEEIANIKQPYCPLTKPK
jgi:hypothetical protein